MKKYYEILGIENNSTQEEIKKSYRKLAIQYHPDRNKDSNASADKFKEVAEAYETLGDIEKRKVYDSKLQKEMMYTMPTYNKSTINWGSILFGVFALIAIVVLIINGENNNPNV